jgi:hypothetical protein
VTPLVVKANAVNEILLGTTASQTSLPGSNSKHLQESHPAGTTHINHFRCDIAVDAANTLISGKLLCSRIFSE